MTTHNCHNDRFMMGLYYAYGRHDAAAAARKGWPPFEPIAFAEHYAALWRDCETGRSSFCPSVQDAWDGYRRAKAS